MKAATRRVDREQKREAAGDREHDEGGEPVAVMQPLVAAKRGSVRRASESDPSSSNTPPTTIAIVPVASAAEQLGELEAGQSDFLSDERRAALGELPKERAERRRLAVLHCERPSLSPNDCLRNALPNT